MPFHLADSKEQALREVAEGLKKWQNEYIVGILGTPQRPRFDDGYAAAKRMSDYGGAIIGTPEDALSGSRGCRSFGRLRHDFVLRARLDLARAGVADL